MRSVIAVIVAARRYAGLPINDNRNARDDRITTPVSEMPARIIERSTPAQTKRGENSIVDLPARRAPLRWIQVSAWNVITTSAAGFDSRMDLPNNLRFDPDGLDYEHMHANDCGCARPPHQFSHVRDVNPPLPDVFPRHRRARLARRAKLRR